MQTSIQLNNLPTPLVPAAAPTDGLVRTEDLDSPLIVEISLWDGMHPGYFVQLLLNGELVGPVWTMSTTDMVGNIITMLLEAKHLSHEGKYTLGFRATNDKSEVSNDSATVPLIVDRTSPGSSLLAPAMVATYSFGDVLKAVIPGYFGMQPGDTLQTLCNEKHGPTYTVRAQDLSTSPIEILFRKDYLESLSSEKISITYHMTDRAGNRSALAPPIEVTIQN